MVATRQMAPSSVTGESAREVEAAAALASHPPDAYADPDDTMSPGPDESGATAQPGPAGEAARPRRRRKRTASGRPGAHDSTRARAPRRAPPPTVAVLIAVLGGLTLLLGFLAVLLTR